MVDFVLNFLGIPFMQPLTFWFMAGIVFALAVVAGWISNEIMGNMTHGIAINAVVLLAGALATLMGWQYLALPLKGQHVYLFIVALGFFPACLLLFSVFIRRFL